MPRSETQHIRAPADLQAQLDLLIRLKYRRQVAELPIMEPAGTQICGDPPSPLARAGAEGDEPVSGVDDPVEANLEIEDGEITLFEAAVGAFHAGDFQRAESLFLEEAQRNDVAPQRAAIAYRQAALAARNAGRRDAADHWMRLAGREYLRVTEDDRTPLPFVREAAVMAAKCFLSVENLHVASKGLRRAQAIESVLRADEDLMAGADRFSIGDPADADQPVIVTDTTARSSAGSGGDSGQSVTEQLGSNEQLSDEGGNAEAVRRLGRHLRRHHRLPRKTV